MTNLLDSFFEKDEEGKTGYERSGNRANLDKTKATNLRVRFEGFELAKYSNKDKANVGENYGLVGFTVLENLDGNEQDAVVEEEYKAFFDFDTKTKKPSAQAKEMESFLILVAGIAGESREKMVRTGKTIANEFMVSGGEEHVGKEYILTGEKTGTSGDTTWHRFVVEEA